VKIIGIILFMFFVLNVNAWAFYDKDYLEYDEYGLKKVKCMRCNETIRERLPRLVRTEGGDSVYVETIKTLSNFTAVPFTLNDGTFTNILMDKDCAKIYQNTPEEIRGMTKQLKRGWVLEATGLKRSQDEISAIENRTRNIKVKERHRFKEDRKR